MPSVMDKHRRPEQLANRRDYGEPVWAIKIAVPNQPAYILPNELYDYEEDAQKALAIADDLGIPVEYKKAVEVQIVRCSVPEMTPMQWTDMPPTEEGYYLFKNKAVLQLKRAYCVRHTPDGPLMQTYHGMGEQDTPVTSIFGHWWYGPIPKPPEREDDFDIQIAIKSEEERRAELAHA